MDGVMDLECNAAMTAIRYHQQHRRSHADRDPGDGQSAALLAGPLDLPERDDPQHGTDDGNQYPDIADKGQRNADQRADPRSIANPLVPAGEPVGLGSYGSAE